MFTRRRFLSQSAKTALALGAGGLFLSRSSEAAEAESLARLRVGILGAANSGRSMLAAALADVAAQSYPSPTYSYRDFAEPQRLSVEPVAIRGFDALVVGARGHRIADFASPRHVRWNLLSGLLPFDTAIVVVSAIEGLPPETFEQLRLARAAGVDRFVIFVSKVDLLDDPELITLAEFETRAALNALDYDGENTPLVATSAREALRTNRSERHRIRKLLDILDGLPRSRPLGRLPVVFRIADVSGSRFEPVVSGYLEQGTLLPGQELHVLDRGLTRRVRVTQVRREAQVPTTDLLTCVLSNPSEINLVHPGASLLDDNGPDYRKAFGARIYLLDNEQLPGPARPPVFNAHRGKFAITQNLPAADFQLELPLNATIERGDFGAVIVNLTDPVPLRLNEPFRLLEGGKVAAIGRISTFRLSEMR